MPGILVTMQTHGIRRLMFTSAMGVGDTYRDAPVMPKLFFRTLLRGIYADKAIGEQMIRNSRARMDDRAAGRSSPTVR